jgi:predicted nuclease of predicted toxin-antitoxin system
MKIVIDMNLSPAWVPVLVHAGHEAVHWSTIGAPTAPDREILAWTRDHGHVLFTHDLDFGAILAATQTSSPSVVQLRTQDVTPHQAQDLLLDVLHRFTDSLTRGALISIDESRSRVRILPISGK